MSRPHLSLLVATTNQGKLSELQSLLADLPIEVLSLADVLPNRPQAVEDCATLEDYFVSTVAAASTRPPTVYVGSIWGGKISLLYPNRCTEGTALPNLGLNHATIDHVLQRISAPPR